MNKKGNAFQLLIGLASSIAAVAVILVVTFIIIGTGKDQIADLDGVNSTAWNATNDVNSAVANGIPVFMPIIILAGIGVVLLGLIALFKH